MPVDAGPESQKYVAGEDRHQLARRLLRAGERWGESWRGENWVEEGQSAGNGRPRKGMEMAADSAAESYAPS